MDNSPKRSGISSRKENTTTSNRVILVVTEGIKTEIVYFEWLKKHYA